MTWRTFVIDTYAEILDGEPVNIIDRLYADSERCMGDVLESLGMRVDADTPSAGTAALGDGGISWGAAPCAASEPDHAVYCAGCGDLMAENGEDVR